MSKRRIPIRKVKRAIILYEIGNLTKSEIARLLRISKSTVEKYLFYYKNSSLHHTDLSKLSDNEFFVVLIGREKKSIPFKYSSLQKQFPLIAERLESESTNLKKLWEEYKSQNLDGYEYSQYVAHFNSWLKNIGVPKSNNNRWRISHIPNDEMKILKQWRFSKDRRKWERAVAILELHKGCPITKLCKKIERSTRTVRKWHKSYQENGLDGLVLYRTRKIDKKVIENVKKKKDRLMKIIHQSPHLYGINRTSWSIKSLSEVYETLYGQSISKSTISEYIRFEGYTFKKARKVLTSPDPEYRNKLQKITDILSNLGPREKFFSVDEFGPFSIKKRGGKALAHKNQIRTFPQVQKSKGILICTAALELSTNQITHFYSNKKNTDEMIRLLSLLLKRYGNEECIYFSWDAASWHASKKLYEKVAKVNSSNYRNKHNTPIVKLAPLPSGAQFLNVIESVFSGMARAIIHNSDYSSVDECKNAIDRYFDDRNQYFIKNPKKAGNKIWGKERVKSVFDEGNNCKDPMYR